MAYSLKNVLSAMTVSLVAVTGVVSAFDGTSYGYSQDFGSSCQPSCPVEPSCCNTGSSFSGGDFFFDVDFLYWKACANGLTYGSENSPITTSSFSGTEIKKKNPHLRWDAGYRIGIGYHSSCECYDVQVIYTHFDTTANSNFAPAVGSTFTPAWAGLAVDTAAVFSDASAHWKLQLNLVDVEFGREFCVNSCLALRPFIGVRFADVQQRYNLKYSGVIGAVDTVVDEFHLKNRFEGAGIRIGTDTTYNLGCGLSLYGQLAGNLLYGERRIRTEERFATTTVVSPTTTVAPLSQRDHDCGISAITDAAIGVRFQHTCCNKVITIDIGYEQHYFFDESLFEKFTNIDGAQVAGTTDRNPQGSKGAVSVQGLVVGAKFQF